ncbi:MAG: hypothetical protein RBS51_01085 [Anaerovoracaceae bacterium]|jgi:hypothetical protein|nr:hypothetical protein [Anaerovoracaceae bacterium]
MKKIIAIILTLLMILTFAACGGESGGGSTGEGSAGGAVYTVEVEELDPRIYPEDYPLMPSEDFETALEVLKEANMNADLDGYQDIADIFGVDGAYYVNNDMDWNERLFKYYGWYADNGRSVLITFVVDGKNLEYYAYTESGI